MRPIQFSNNPSFGLDNRMTIVLFAGMGGGCDGLEDAGFHVHLAINHDPVAVAVHQKRHPHTRHERCDVFEVCPKAATQGRGVRVLAVYPPAGRAKVWRLRVWVTKSGHLASGSKKSHAAAVGQVERRFRSFLVAAELVLEGGAV